MPQAAPHQCAQAGCPELVARGQGRCPVHETARKAGADARRGSARARGYDSRWAKASAAYVRDHPLCVVCLAKGRTTPSRVVDHIVPHKGDPTLFWSRDNWQALCIADHNAKTAREDGGFGNRRGGAQSLRPIANGPRGRHRNVDRSSFPGGFAE